jgi:hypothetical protein
MQRVARNRTSWVKGAGPPTRYQQGASGNPGGRPKNPPDVIEMARALTPRAIGALDKALDDADNSVAIHAAQVLLDRAWGRPAQMVFAAVNTAIVGGIDSPPRESLAQWLSRRKAELAALDGPRQQAATSGESAQPASASPSGETAAQDERASEQATSLRPESDRSAASSAAGPSKPPEQEEWLRRERRRLGLDSDDPRPNPTWKR